MNTFLILLFLILLSYLKIVIKQKNTIKKDVKKLEKKIEETEQHLAETVEAYLDERDTNQVFSKMLKEEKTKKEELEALNKKLSVLNESQSQMLKKEWAKNKEADKLLKTLKDEANEAWRLYCLSN